jgi:hypothetical protein
VAAEPRWPPLPPSRCLAAALRRAAPAVAPAIDQATAVRARHRGAPRVRLTQIVSAPSSIRRPGPITSPSWKSEPREDEDAALLEDEHDDLGSAATRGEASRRVPLAITREMPAPLLTLTSSPTKASRRKSVWG